MEGAVRVVGGDGCSCFFDRGESTFHVLHHEPTDSQSTGDLDPRAISTSTSAVARSLDDSPAATREATPPNDAPTRAGLWSNVTAMAATSPAKASML